MSFGFGFGVPSQASASGGATLNFQFAGATTLDPRITFTRASTGTYTDSAGVLQSAAIDAPRFDYDPVTLAAKGFLIEEQRTNSIRNNTMVGAVTGTPGTLPTNWSVSGGAAAGLTRTVVGVGTEAGINYIDLRFQGTPSAGSLNIIFENDASAATLNQVWAQSAYVSIVGGSLNNVSALNLRFDEGSPYVRTTTTTNISTLTSKLVRYSGTGTIGATTTRITGVYLNAFCAAAPIDITLRIGLPQLELGAFATSVIPTTTAAATRSADVASVNTLSPWYNASEGTLFAEASSFVLGNAALASFDDGTSNNTINLTATNTTGTVFFGLAVSGVNQLTGSTVTGTTVPVKAAIGYKTNDTAWSLSGGAASTDTSVSLPTVTQLQLGRRGAGAILLSGYLRRITYYPRRLSNAELVGITA